MNLRHIEKGLKPPVVVTDEKARESA